MATVASTEMKKAKHEVLWVIVENWIQANPEKNAAAREELREMLEEHPRDATEVGKLREKYEIPRPVGLWMEMQSDIVKFGMVPGEALRRVCYLVEKEGDKEYWGRLPLSKTKPKGVSDGAKARAKAFCESVFGKRVAAWLEQELRAGGPINWTVFGWGRFLPKGVMVRTWLADESMSFAHSVERGCGQDYCELKELSPDERPIRVKPALLPDWIYDGAGSAAEVATDGAVVKEEVAARIAVFGGVEKGAALSVGEEKKSEEKEIIEDDVLVVREEAFEKEETEEWMRYTSLFQRSRTQPAYEVFAFFPKIYGDTEGAFRILAKKAKKECWAASNGLWGNVDYLMRYLNGTFKRLEQEGKIIYTKDGDWACFNTGLQSRENGRDILALFRANLDAEKKGADVPKWYFYKFFSTNEVDLENFTKARAEAAEYYSKTSDLVFDLEYKLMWDSVAFVEQNKDWLPDVLRRDTRKTMELIDAKLKELKGRIRRDYRFAVPCWYQEKLRLLVPLYLTNGTKADAVLVLAKDEEHKCYRTDALLPMRGAYVAARLLGRVESEWLREIVAD